MKNILFATDFSNNAYNALFFVTNLFKEHHCRIYMMNAFTEHTELLTQKVGTNGSRSLISQLSDESREGLNETFHRIQLDQANSLHHYQLISRNAAFTDAVNQLVEEFDIDLLVMGHGGQSGLTNRLWGSNVIKAIRDVNKCSILTIPREVECDLPKEIAFATDYRHHYSAKILDPLISIASTCGSNVCIMHINEEQRLNSEQKTNLNTLREYLGNIQHTIHWMPNFTSKSLSISIFLDELNIGMLVMARHPRGFFSRIFREAVVEKLSFAVDIPLLILPASD